jgi:hypothetical protein
MIANGTSIIQQLMMMIDAMDMLIGEESLFLVCAEHSEKAFRSEYRRTLQFALVGESTLGWNYV